MAEYRESLTVDPRPKYVTIPTERYEDLIDAETRLTILFNMRKAEILNAKEYTYKKQEDHVISHKLEDAWVLREEKQALMDTEASDE